MSNSATQELGLHTYTNELVTTSEVAAALGITRQAVLQRVNAGTLRPIYKSPARTGGYLFSAPDVFCLAPELTR
ncbi:hypothetical protein HQQ88_08165 [Curtobacterium sp. VKM Ac-2861]|uniref:hypothetical protein n=1 Tax=Curtobacterium sp. VKM Ac-2861 TaxID=2739016 RepID=UPI001563AD8E|nr:hypothetical protein [Curtobacterium sp. VKM Ac-2861]